MNNVEQHPLALLQMREVLARDLRSRGRVAVVFVLPVLFFMREVMADAYASSGAVRSLFAAAVSLTVLRAVVSYCVDAAGAGVRWYVLILPASLVGVSVGAMTVAAYPYLTPTEIALLAACVTGLNSVASVSMSPSRIAYFLYMVPMLGGFAAAAFVWPRPELGPWFGSLVLFYAAALSAMALHVNAARRKLLSLQLRFRDLAHRDAVTNLFNRRHLAEYMSLYAGDLAADPRPYRGDRRDRRRTLGVIVVDLDNFKRINDRYGHDAGDAVLRQFARLLEKAVRETDVVARWGGDEFVVLAPDADRAGLRKVAERIREKADGRVFPLPSGVTVRTSCSLGYCAWELPPGARGAGSWQEVLAIADKGLNHAKKLGRNRAVGVFPGDGISPAAPEVVKVIASSGFEETVRSGLIEIVMTEEELFRPHLVHSA
jgi:diguanylate cyclase (GGDEF)-like protein